MQEPSKKHILIVEDDEMERDMFKFVLSRYYQVSTVDSGQASLTFLQGSISSPDLILLDILMPFMDGFDTYREIRKLPSCGDVPIIFITCTTDPGAMHKAMSLGAVDYINKPFILDKFLLQIKDALYRNDCKIQGIAG